MGLDIRYARSGGVSIAYQVVGDGDVDLVYVPDYISNLVYGWESPQWREFYERLAERFRLILFDKRGTGLSDLGGHFPALETRMDDVRAVLDAVGSTRTGLLGSHDGCSMAVLFAATYPERTRALALFHPSHTIPTWRTRRRSRSWRPCARSGARRSSRTSCSRRARRRSMPTRNSESGSPTGCAWGRARRWPTR